MKRIYDRFFASQLAKPTGLFGRFYIKRLLNAGNRRSNELALQHLQLPPTARVLEIGFGGGWLIERLADLATEGKVVGLDHSKTMVESAKRKLRTHGDKVELVCGSADKLPFESESFTHVVTCHTLYFWKNPKQVLSEINRVLRPGGTLVIGLNSKEKLEDQPVTRHGFTLYDPETVVQLLSSCAFQNVALHSYDPDEWEDNHCVVAQRPA